MLVIKYLLAIGIILILLFGWVMVQYIYRRFSIRHPELGPYRDDLGSCGSCGCGGGTDSCNSE